ASSTRPAREIRISPPFACVLNRNHRRRNFCRAPLSVMKREVRMLLFIREAGWPIFPIGISGVVSLVAAMRYAESPRRELFGRAVGLTITTLILGLLGTVLGVQMSARYIGEIPEKWIFLIGLKESLNNLVASLVFATIVSLVLTLRGA